MVKLEVGPLVGKLNLISHSSTICSSLEDLPYMPLHFRSSYVATEISDVISSV